MVIANKKIRYYQIGLLVVVKETSLDKSLEVTTIFLLVSISHYTIK
jgi:hypothetical protein